MTYFPGGGIPGNSGPIIIKMREDLNGSRLHLQNSGEKSSQGPEKRVNLVCFQNSCSASVSRNQQRRTPRQASLHPFCLTKRQNKKNKKKREATLKSPKLGRTPWKPARIRCATVWFRNRLIVLWPIPGWFKRRGGKWKKMYKANKGVVFFVVFRCHWAKGGGAVNGAWTQGERMCSNFAIKKHWKKRGATRWVASWCEGAWQPHQMRRCWETFCIHNTPPRERLQPHCAGQAN